MQVAKIIEFPQVRNKKSKANIREKVNAGKTGSVFSRGGKLWVDFRYLGQRVREPSALDDCSSNRRIVREQLDLIIAEIDNEDFEFAKRFPHSKNKKKYSILEGKTFGKSLEEVIFKDYVAQWWEEMGPGLTEGQKRDYSSILKTQILPFFGELAFSEIKTICIKKFLAQLNNKKNRYGNPLAAKTINNYIIPLRVIYNDAVVEYEWDGLKNPFREIKLPKPVKRRIQPFNYEEWVSFLDNMFYWYKPYFEFAVQTGLRPSEQVALKWGAIDNEFIHIELSRVRNLEKADLKTDGSNRRIELRPNMRKTLEKQRELAKKFKKPYVFITTKGLPIRQENLGKRWRKAIEKSKIRYKRMYETRHTFASWALAAGETPEWVARTLGHVNSSMIYRTYGRYIPNLTHHDGSEFEKRYAKALSGENKNSGTIGHNVGHNLQDLNK